MPSSFEPSLIVHGGAWPIPDEAVEDCRAGCRAALQAGWHILTRGGSAVEAVEAAIVVLEDHPVFDAGVGSHLNLDGVVELDAILMDGTSLQAGAVAAVRRVRNPIRLARRILEAGQHILLVAEGAERFAADHGFPLCSPDELIVPRERAAWARCQAAGGHQAAFHAYAPVGACSRTPLQCPEPSREGGTVGAVARDRAGNIAAGTSTGGTCCKHPGRVGDSPLIGCGCYADSAVGGASATGWGEAIMRLVLAKSAVDLLVPVAANGTCPQGPQGRSRGTSPPPLQPSAAPGSQSSDRSVAPASGPSPVHVAPASGRPERLIGASLQTGPLSPSPASSACATAIRLLASRLHATGGLILLDAAGNPAAAFNTPRMAFASRSPDGSLSLSP